MSQIVEIKKNSTPAEETCVPCTLRENVWQVTPEAL
jgi:hypothetical protein